jgi:hypothetical protein
LQSVQVGAGGAIHVEGAATDVIDGLVVDEDGHVSVLKE